MACLNAIFGSPDSLAWSEIGIDGYCSDGAYRTKSIEFFLPTGRGYALQRELADSISADEYCYFRGYDCLADLIREQKPSPF